MEKSTKTNETLLKIGNEIDLLVIDGKTVTLKPAISMEVAAQMASDSDLIRKFASPRKDLSQFDQNKNIDVKK